MNDRIRHRYLPQGRDARLLPRAAAGGEGGASPWSEGETGWSVQAREVTYRVRPIAAGGGRAIALDARIEGEDWEPVAASLQPLYRHGGESHPAAWTAESGIALKSARWRFTNGILSWSIDEELAGSGMECQVRFQVYGAALQVEVIADSAGGLTGYAGFSIEPDPAAAERQASAPGLPDPLLVTPAGRFASFFADRYRGRATSYGAGSSHYSLMAGGTARPMNDFFWVACSLDPLAPLPALRRPSSQYRADLLDRVTLDFYSERPFEEDERLLRLMQLYGLHDVFLIYRNWQYYGYRRRGPLQFPADPDRGGSDALRRVCAAVRESGWRLALREEYANLMPDSPYWDEKALALSPSGAHRQSPASRRPAVAANKMVDFARLEATDIQRNYSPNGSFVDGHTSWNPEGGFAQVDLGPDSHCASESQAIAEAENLYSFLRSVHSGPVIGAAGAGPARFDSFAAGGVEAVIRGPDGGVESPLIVDYELQEVLPSILGLGAGSYRQFCGFRAGRPVAASQVDWDAYRATEIALGHAGYVGNYGIRASSRNIPFPGGSASTAVREYFLLRALQGFYLGASAQEVRYRAGEEMLSLAEALRRGMDFVNPQLRIQYAGGLQVWVNRSGKESWSVTCDEGEFLLPPSGFLAVAPRQRLLAYSAICRGHHVDYCSAQLPRYTFLDARGEVVRSVGDLEIDGAVCLFKGDAQRRTDLVMVAATRLRTGGEEYRLSTRGDVRFAHRTLREVEITLLDIHEGSHAHVTWPAWDPGWSCSHWEIQEREQVGEWRPSEAEIQMTRQGPQLLRARAGVTYQVRPRG